MTDKPALNCDLLDLDADGRLDQDLICLKCGYNLRGLSPEGRCPECGTAIGRSLHGDKLQYCDPEWVDRLASGMNYIWWSLALLILAPVSLPLLPFPIVYMFATTEESASRAITCGYLLLICLFLIIGIWLLTTPNPAEVKSDQWCIRPNSIRHILMIFVPFVLAGIPLLVFTPNSSPLIVVALVPPLLFLLLVILSLRYARILAVREDDAALAIRTRFAMYGWCLGWLIIVVTALSQLITSLLQSSQQQLSGPSNTITGIVFLVGGIVFVFFGFWLLHLVERYFKLMQASAESARLTWAKEPFALVHPPDHR